MSEELRPPESLPHRDPILKLAHELGTPFTEESEELLARFKPRMDLQEKTGVMSQLQEKLQLEAEKSGDIDMFYQVCHQIGIVLTTAHAHYQSEGTWPEVAQELDDAYYMADQTAAAGKPAFNIIALRIDKLMKDLAGKQYRT